MTNINELIETTNKLSQNLEQAANEEIRFCVDIQMRLESMAWEIFRMSNELREIKYYTQ